MRGGFVQEGRGGREEERETAAECIGTAEEEQHERIRLGGTNIKSG
jgi:hypothetical protein